VSTNLFRSSRHVQVLVVWLVAGLCISLPSLAYAEGGTSIATAPTVVPGQQEFGNLVNGAVVGCRGEGGERTNNAWWLLPVTVGDHVVVDWEGSFSSRGGLVVYPVGTTDFNYPQTAHVLVQQLNGNGKNEATLTVKQSGTMPMLITSSLYSNLCGTPGPYSFTASFTHALNVALPHVRSLQPKGHITVAVHNPEGGTIGNPSLHVELQAQHIGGAWQTLGSAIVSNSAAIITYTAPRRFAKQMMMLRAIARGSGYITTASRSARMRVN
jgi:hypothetical protein